MQEDGTVAYGERQDNWPLPVDNTFVWILLILLSHCVSKSKSLLKSYASYTSVNRMDN